MMKARHLACVLLLSQQSAPCAALSPKNIRDGILREESLFSRRNAGWNLAAMWVKIALFGILF